MTETDKVRERQRQGDRKTGIQIETETTKDSEGAETLGETQRQRRGKMEGDRQGEGQMKDTKTERQGLRRDR